MVLFDAHCPCSPACFCKRIGVCRDTAEEPPAGADRRATDKMPPLVPASKSKRIEIDFEDPESVADFMQAVVDSIRAKRRIVLIVE